MKSATPGAGGRRRSVARSWLPLLMMMVTQWRVKMDGRFISSRLIQTGSIGGKPDRTGGGQPQRTYGSEKRSVVRQREFMRPRLLSGRGMKLLPAERTTISHEAEFHGGRSPCSRPSSASVLTGSTDCRPSKE